MCCMFSRVRLREQAHRCVYARVCVYCHDAAWVINDGVRLWGFSLAVACGRGTSRHILCFVWNSLLALPLRWRLLVWQTARSNCNLTNAKKKKMCRKVQTLCRESYISSAARSKRWVVEDGASSPDSSCFYSSDGWSAHIAGTETESMNNNKK